MDNIITDFHLKRFPYTIIIIIPIIVVYNIRITFFAKIDHWSFTCFYKIDWKMMTGKEIFKLVISFGLTIWYCKISSKILQSAIFLDLLTFYKLFGFWISLMFWWHKISLISDFPIPYPSQFLKTRFMMLFDEMQLLFQNLPYTYLTLLYMCT